MSFYEAGTEKSWTDRLSTETYDVTAEIPFDLQLAHFVDVMNGVKEPSCDAAAGLSALVVCDAIKQSMKTGMPVEINPVQQQ